MITSTRSTPKPVSTIPTTTVALPTTTNAPAPSKSGGTLQVKDGFESAPATKQSAAVKTDALNTRTLDPNEVTRLQTDLANAKQGKGDVKAATEALASYVMGAPVKVIYDMSEAKPGQLNMIIPNRKNGVGNESGWTFSEGDPKSSPVDLGANAKPAVMVLNANLLNEKSPARLQKVAFHEGTHLAHANETRALYADFKANKRPGEDFEKFLGRQKNLTPAQRELYLDESTGGRKNTETIAHVESFIGSFMKMPHGADKTARLANEGAELFALSDHTPSKNVGIQERDKLLAFYEKLPAADQKALRDTLRDLPSNWLTKDPKIAKLLKTP
ncbi:MAG: hypothetical protein QM817_41120 [Archangium sp.]